MNDAINAGTLLPCPFCEGNPHLTCGGPGNWYVHCTDCKVVTDDGARDRVTKLWNTRALRPAPSAADALSPATEVRREAIKSPGEAGASHNSGERDPSVMTDHSPGELSRCELRTLARLAWNGWPDNDASRKIIADHESRDKHSADAWDRVVTILALPCADEAAIRADEREKCAKIADPWPGFEISDTSSDTERAVVNIRTAIAQAIRNGGKQP